MKPIPSLIKLVKLNHKILSDQDRLDIIDFSILMLTQFGVVDTSLTKCLTMLTNLRTRLAAAVNKKQASDYTVEMNLLDKKRHSLVSDIENALSFYSGHDNPELAAAGNLIKPIFDSAFDRVTDNKQSTFSAAIKEFLGNIQSPEAIEALGKITADGKVALLSTTQTKFDDDDLLRVEEEADDDVPTLGEVRQEIITLFPILGKELLLNVYFGDAAYEELTEKLNVKFGMIIATAKSRHTHEENSDNEDDNDAPTGSHTGGESEPEPDIPDESVPGESEPEEPELPDESVPGEESEPEEGEEPEPFPTHQGNR